MEFLESTYQLVFNPHIDIYGGAGSVARISGLLKRSKVTDKQNQELKALQKTCH